MAGPKLQCPDNNTLTVSFCAVSAEEAENLAEVFTLISFECPAGCVRFAKATATPTDGKCDPDPLTDKERKKYKVDVSYGCKKVTKELAAVRKQVQAAVKAAKTAKKGHK